MTLTKNHYKNKVLRKKRVFYKQRAHILFFSCLGQKKGKGLGWFPPKVTFPLCLKYENNNVPTRGVVPIIRKVQTTPPDHPTSG